MLLIYLAGLGNHRDPNLPKINEAFMYDLNPIQMIWEYSTKPRPIDPIYNTKERGSFRNTSLKDYQLLFS